MSDKNLPVDLGTEIGDLKQRLDALERQLRPIQAAFKPDIVFSHDGPLSASESPTYVTREARRVIEVVARLRTAGTTQTDISVHKNGVEALAVTIPADQLAVNVPCNIFLAADQDVLHDEITAAGSGAEALTVIHRFRR